MTSLAAAFLTLPAISLILLALVPLPASSRGAVGMRRLVTLLAGLQAVLAAVMLVLYAAGTLTTIDARLLTASAAKPLALGVYYDGAAALMFALVSFVGWGTCRYSIRYLDGEATQGRYFRWTGFTIGSVSLLVISGNLLMFAVCWLMTSLGLHQLLLHYGHRGAAQRAAWTKFIISRIGDAGMLGAIALIYWQFKTLDFAALPAAAEAFGPATPSIQIAGFLLVIAAITKSAQFPFHTWLPQTMETPTPVSALMHAGIVNAGGYLMIRTSPLLGLTPTALFALAIIGAITACLGAVVMLTQTSIKKSLAYSTIAQMGFMMLQCGLGAFSAAMLHIVAHSLYKAHAFLSSGSVISARATEPASGSTPQPVRWTQLMAVSSIMVAFLSVAFVAFGVDLMAKPGGLLLGVILCLALTSWVLQVARVNNQALLIRSLAIAGVLCVAYVAAFLMVDKLVATGAPLPGAAMNSGLVAAVVLVGFIGMFALQLKLSRGQAPRWLHAWYVHASNGFYFENLLRRVFGPLGST